MFYGAPVTAPMEMPVEPPPSYTRNDLPEIGNPNAVPELPKMVDAGLKGIRLQGTLAKALPPMKEAGSMTNVRQMEAEKYAGEMAYVFNISRQQQQQNRLRAKARERATERLAKNFGVR